jgi:hypothetical protein
VGGDVSYAFDLLERVWADRIRPHLPADEVWVLRYELLLKELHEANHRLDDQINKDPSVTKKAGALDKEMCDELEP